MNPPLRLSRANTSDIATAPCAHLATFNGGEHPMTLHNDQDPGWWRRGMSKRGITIVVIVCVVLIIGGFVVMAMNGIPLF